MTRLRAEGIKWRRAMPRRIWWWSTLAVLSILRWRVAGCHRRSVAENGKVIVTGCLGAERRKSSTVIPGAENHRPAALRRGVARRASRPAAETRTVRRSVPAQGIKLTPRHDAYLKISEGCNHRCSFCIIPSMRGDLSAGRSARIPRSGTAGARGREGNGDSPGHERLWRRFKIAALTWRDVRMPHQFTIWPRRSANRRVDTPALCLSVSACRSGDRSHGGRNDPPVSRYSLSHGSARILKLMKRPAAAENTLARIAAWRHVVPEITIRSTLSSVFPAKRSGLPGIARADARGAIDRVGCFYICRSRAGSEHAQVNHRAGRTERRSAARVSWKRPREISAERLSKRSAGDAGIHRSHRSRQRRCHCALRERCTRNRRRDGAHSRCTRRR